MKKTNEIDSHDEVNLERRNALRKLGLVATAVYVAPAMMTLSKSAQASPEDDAKPSEPSKPSMPSVPSSPDSDSHESNDSGDDAPGSTDSLDDIPSLPQT